MKKSIWIIIAIYIFLIYSTLSVTPLILNFLYTSLEQKFLTIIVNIIFIIITLLIIYFLIKKKKLKISFFLLIFLFLILFWITQIEKPAERIHFLEYGILGVLIFKATGEKVKQNIFGIILLVMIAVIDELIQYMLPNRVGDIKDVIMNIIGGIIGLWLGKFWYQS